MSRIDQIKARYDAIHLEQYTGVLESFRFRDSDLAVRGGGLLGFSGLMMASDLVFLFASTEPKPPWKEFALAAALVLAAGAWFAYRSLSMSVTYGDATTARVFLERWERILLRRSRMQQVGAALTALGTATFLLAMLGGHCAQRQWCLFTD